MKKDIDIVTDKMIREDTRVVFQKVNEMKSSWDDLFGAVPDIAAKAYNKFSNYSKKAVANATSGDERAKDFANIPRTITRTPGSPEAKQAQDQLEKEKKQPNVGSPSSDLPDTRDPRGDAAPNMAKAKEIAAKTGKTQNDSSGKAVGGADYKPEDQKSQEAPKADSKTAMSFKQAFAKARKEAGGSKGQFEYGGKKYQTNFQGTGTKEKPQEKYISASKQKVTSVKSGSDSAAPKAAETPKAPEAPKPQEAPKTPDAAETPKTDTTPTTAPTDTTPKTDAEPKAKASVTTAPDGADGASIEGGQGGKGGKGGQSLKEWVEIGNNKYRII